MRSLYTVPEGMERPYVQEFIEVLLRGGHGLRVERIVSWGHITPEGQWYDQENDEWVAVLEGRARLGYEDGSELTLEPGQHVLLPRHVRHRVVYTSSPCVWLAVHAPDLDEGGPSPS